MIKSQDTSRRKAQARLTLVFLSFVILFAQSTTCAGAKDDIVTFTNGDRMTGEVKSLERGELRFKADYMVEAVRLDWKRLARIESKSSYIVTLISGQLYTGTIRLASPGVDGADNFVIRAGNQSFKVGRDEVIRILPFETRFLQQLNGSVDYGFGYTSGNSQYQSQVSATANYRKGSNSITGSTNVEFSGQSGGSSTARYDVYLDYRRLFRERWFAGGLLNFLSSEQQSLDLRTTAGALLGRSLLLTDRTNLSLGAGMVVARERYKPTASLNPLATNADVLIGLDFYTFRFKTTDISSRLLVYPSITLPGRVRMELDSRLRIEVFKDFYWSLNLYENFDNQPPINAKRNDLGISSSFGWKF
jgi:hypothetical protein